MAQSHWSFTLDLQRSKAKIKEIMEDASPLKSRAEDCQHLLKTTEQMINVLLCEIRPVNARASSKALSLPSTLG